MQMASMACFEYLCIREYADLAKREKKEFNELAGHTCGKWDFFSNILYVFLIEI